MRPAGSILTASGGQVRKGQVSPCPPPCRNAIRPIVRGRVKSPAQTAPEMPLTARARPLLPCFTFPSHGLTAIPTRGLAAKRLRQSFMRSMRAPPAAQGLDSRRRGGSRSAFGIGEPCLMSDQARLRMRVSRPASVASTSPMGGGGLKNIGTMARWSASSSGRRARGGSRRKVAGTASS